MSDRLRQALEDTTEIEAALEQAKKELVKNRARMEYLQVLIAMGQRVAIPVDPSWTDVDLDPSPTGVTAATVVVPPLAPPPPARRAAAAAPPEEDLQDKNAEALKAAEQKIRQAKERTKRAEEMVAAAQAEADAAEEVRKETEERARKAEEEARRLESQVAR